MKNKYMLVLIAIVIVFASTACSRSYHGIVIDAETRQPIEGAVVVASWRGERALLTAQIGRLDDVRETLTDKEGKWKIRGQRGWNTGTCTTVCTLVTGIYVTQPPEFIIFKPGYCSWPKGYFIDACKGIKPGGNHPTGIAELPKLTKREDRLRNSAISLPDEKKCKRRCLI